MESSLAGNEPTHVLGRLEQQQEKSGNVMYIDKNMAGEAGIMALTSGAMGYESQPCCQQQMRVLRTLFKLAWLSSMLLLEEGIQLADPCMFMQAISLDGQEV